MKKPYSCNIRLYGRWNYFVSDRRVKDEEFLSLVTSIKEAKDRARHYLEMLESNDAIARNIKMHVKGNVYHFTSIGWEKEKKKVKT